MTELSVTENIIKYRAFIADILVPRLKDAKDRKSVVASEVDEYRKFELKVIEMQKSFPEDFQTLVDLGRGCQVRAAVPPSETIFMNVGLGVFVEIPMTDVADTCSQRIGILEKKIGLISHEIEAIDTDIHQAEDLVLQLESLDGP